MSISVEVWRMNDESRVPRADKVFSIRTENDGHQTRRDDSSNTARAPITPSLGETRGGAQVQSGIGGHAETLILICPAPAWRHVFPACQLPTSYVH